MCTERYVLTYNGEIYNFREIRNDLEKKGWRFNSHSDTEVLLRAFEEWGPECLRRFRGMWAFALWDKNKEELFLCRDRIGVKPLYWYSKDGLVLFASEIRALCLHPRFSRNLNRAGVSMFFQYGYIPSPISIFENVLKLEPGHYLQISRNGMSKTCYWDAKRNFTLGEGRASAFSNRSEESILEELESILSESFKLRLISDVPVGVFLSGGIDSSLLTTLLLRENGTSLKTFTIGFKQPTLDESGWAKRVASFLGTEHTEFYLEPHDARDVLLRLPEIFDEPFGDSSAIPTHLICKLARSHVKVALSGDGGDEQFCGYASYFAVEKRLRPLLHIPFKNVIAGMFKMLGTRAVYPFFSAPEILGPQFKNLRDKYAKLGEEIGSRSPLHQYENIEKTFFRHDLEELGINDFSNKFDFFDEAAVAGLDDVSQMMLLDQKSYLPDDILTKVDRASMNVALECREPFLDHNILEFSSQLPIKFKLKNGISKPIFRKLLSKYLPMDLIERPKMGFSIPEHDWLRTEFSDICREYLCSDELKKGGILNSIQVRRIVEDFMNGKGIGGTKVWYLLVFEMWRRKYFR